MKLTDTTNTTGMDAEREKGWWLAHKWLLLRRIVQFSIIALFLLGPLAGIWIIKGNMSSSLLLESVPLSDPFVFLQTVLTGVSVQQTVLMGAIIIFVFYFLVGGRVYCGWVCPINIVTDAADWLRRKLNLKSKVALSRNNRSIILLAILCLSVFTGMLVWELINPVTMFQRELVFGMGISWLLLLSIFFLDAFISRRAWCGHLCPMGKFYSYIGKYSLIRVNAAQRDRCNDCMDCYTVCPEPQVIKPALKGSADQSPVILSGECTNCGQCIDVCAKDVFSLGHRFINPELHNSKSDTSQREVSL